MGPRRYREISGLYYEDFEPGDVFEHRPGRTILEVDNVWFTLLTMSTQQVYFAAAYRARTEWKKLLVDSTFTLALLTGMSVRTVSAKVVARTGPGCSRRLPWPRTPLSPKDRTGRGRTTARTTPQTNPCRSAPDRARRRGSRNSPAGRGRKTSRPSGGSSIPLLVARTTDSNGLSRFPGCLLSGKKQQRPFTIQRPGERRPARVFQGMARHFSGWLSPGPF
ncbi:MAG: MaoC family dehydratase [Solirubrobacterales bacterium]|nr:MaoC family dehydratase [Solirubrobacterales bacterium]